jgi:hypothetical protein
LRDPGATDRFHNEFGGIIVWAAVQACARTCPRQDCIPKRAALRVGGDARPPPTIAWPDCESLTEGYVFFFEYVRDRLASYRAVGSLRCYVLSVLHSEYAYTDYLRRTRGRLPKIPRSVQARGERAARVYREMQKGRSLGEIAGRLRLSCTDVQREIERLEEIPQVRWQAAAWRRFMAPSPVDPLIVEDTLVDAGSDTAIEAEQLLALSQIAEALNGLHPGALALLHLLYDLGAPARAVAEICAACGLEELADVKRIYPYRDRALRDAAERLNLASIVPAPGKESISLRERTEWLHRQLKDGAGLAALLEYAAAPRITLHPAVPRTRGAQAPTLPRSDLQRLIAYLSDARRTDLPAGEGDALLILQDVAAPDPQDLAGLGILPRDSPN